MQLYAVNFIPLLGQLYTHHKEYNFQLYLQPLVQTTLSSQLLTPSVAWYM
jgi:hypothetical protein